MLQNFIGSLGALWNLLLLAFAIVALLGFVYAIYVRRALRARRIAHLRDRRLLREAAERESRE